MSTAPELWADLKYRLRALFRRGAMERELAEELRFHLEREAEKYQRAGASPEEALRRAVRSAWKKGVEKRPMVLPVVLEM